MNDEKKKPEDLKEEDIIVDEGEYMDAEGPQPEEDDEDEFEELIETEEDKKIEPSITQEDAAPPTETEYKSQRDRARERIDKYNADSKAKKAAKMMVRKKEQLKKAADKFNRKRRKLRDGHTPMRDLKNYDSELIAEKAKDPDEIMVPRKITPEVERILFPYFVSGASIRSIYQQFGHKHDFSLQSMYTARDFYKWEQRKNMIQKVVRNDNDLAVAERFKDYYAFMDDLISEAMIRFKNNSDAGNNTNPFNTLKITTMKDFKDVVELMMNVLHGGVKKLEVEHSGKVKLGNKKRSKLLEVLAEEDEEE